MDKPERWATLKDPRDLLLLAGMLTVDEANAIIGEAYGRVAHLPRLESQDVREMFEAPFLPNDGGRTVDSARVADILDEAHDAEIAAATDWEMSRCLDFESASEYLAFHAIPAAQCAMVRRVIRWPR